MAPPSEVEEGFAGLIWCPVECSEESREGELLCELTLICFHLSVKLAGPHRPGHSFHGCQLPLRFIRVPSMLTDLAPGEHATARRPCFKG